MAHKKTVLIFPNLHLLWEFAQTIDARSIEIQTATRTLICDCEDADIALAKNKYHAVVKESISSSL